MWFLASELPAVNYIKTVFIVAGTRCENLADLIWQNRQQIKKVELLRTQLPINVPTGCQDLLPILNTTITGLLSSLVTRSFQVLFCNDTGILLTWCAFYKGTERKAVESTGSWGYWCWRTGERLGDPPPRCSHEPLVVRDKDGRPSWGPPWWCTASVYAVGSCTMLGDLLGVSRSLEHDFLSVLSIYPRNFLCVLFYRLLLGISYCF